MKAHILQWAKKAAQNGDYVRAGSTEEFDTLWEKSNSLIKLITIAPEALTAVNLLTTQKNTPAFQLGIRRQMQMNAKRQ